MGNGGHGANSGGAPGILHAKGEDWILDGDRWVPKRLVDQYGSPDDIPWSSPDERMQSSMERSEGTNTQYREQAAQSQGDTSGQDGDYKYHSEIGPAETKYRTDLSNSLGTTRKSDSSPKGVLADLLYFGHADALPGQNGMFFAARGDGTFTFYDSNGNQVPPNDALIQAGKAGVAAGYGTGAIHGGNAAGGGAPTNPTSLPPAPGTTGSTIVKPKTDPIYSSPPNPAATTPGAVPPPPTDTHATTPPAQDLTSLTVGAGNAAQAGTPGATSTSLPEAPRTFNTVPQVKAPPMPKPMNVPDYMGAFAPAGSRSTGMQLPKAPAIGNTTGNIGKGIGNFKIGG